MLYKGDIQSQANSLQQQGDTPPHSEEFKDCLRKALKILEEQNEQ